MTDLPEFFKAAVANTAFLVPVIWAITTLFGKFGVSGRWQLVVSVVSGLILGSGMQVYTVGMPVTFQDYFVLGFFGLIPGLVASGVYDTGKHIVEQNAVTILDDEVYKHIPPPMSIDSSNASIFYHDLSDNYGVGGVPDPDDDKE